MSNILPGKTFIKGNIFQKAGEGMRTPFSLAPLTDAELADPYDATLWEGSVAYSSDNTLPVYSDGTNWRSFIDNAIVV